MICGFSLKSTSMMIGWLTLTTLTPIFLLSFINIFIVSELLTVYLSDSFLQDFFDDNFLGSDGINGQL